MNVAFLFAALALVEVSCAEEEVPLETCVVSDALSALQLHLQPKTYESHLTNARDCDSTLFGDVAAERAYIRENTDESLIDRYKLEGKISQHGMPILQMVHIPKTGGAAMGMSGAPLGDYGFGALNKGWLLHPESATNLANGCILEHNPPMDLTPSYATWVYGESEVFCAVRDPWAKAISGACHVLQYRSADTAPPSCKCSPASTDKCTLDLDAACIDGAIQKEIQEYQKLRSYARCFWIPQVDYLKGQFGCRHVLDFDNLESEFNGLMKQYGMSEITLVPRGLDGTHTCAKSCNVTKTDLSAKTIEIMEELYGEDIKFWENLRHNRSVGGPMYGR